MIYTAARIHSGQRSALFGNWKAIQTIGGKLLLLT
jgi:hypothetical protein